jgi:hypothetical protein
LRPRLKEEQEKSLTIGRLKMEEFTKLFITMCEKVSDLQSIWIPTEWDYCCNKETREPCHLTSKLTKEDKEDKKKKYFWLPHLYLKDQEEVEKISQPTIIATREKDFQAEKDAGAIEIYEKTEEVSNLQLSMYVYFRKKWDKETQEWIDI